MKTRCLFFCFGMIVSFLFVSCGRRQDGTAIIKSEKTYPKSVPLATPDDIAARKEQILRITNLINSEGFKERKLALLLGLDGRPDEKMTEAFAFYSNIVLCALQHGNVEHKDLIDDFVRSIARAQDKHSAEDAGNILWFLTKLAIQGRYPADADSFWDPKRVDKSEEWWLNTKLRADMIKR